MATSRLKRSTAMLRLGGRIAAYVVAGLLLLAAAAVAFAYFLARQSLPDYSGARQVDGIRHPVVIVRDAHAIPHVFGDADEDVFYGLGFAHAQDRLWQMLLGRALIQGRLSERFGERSLEQDLRMRDPGAGRIGGARPRQPFAGCAKGARILCERGQRVPRRGRGGIPRTRRAGAPGVRRRDHRTLAGDRFHRRHQDDGVPALRRLAIRRFEGRNSQPSCRRRELRTCWRPIRIPA